MRGLWLSALLLQACFYIDNAEYAGRWDLDADGVGRPADCDDQDGAVQLHTWFVDGDGDGFGGSETVEGCDQPEGAVDNDDDCDDADEALHPGAPELCNGADDDCDQEVDEEITFMTWYADADEDGFGDPGTAVEACDTPPGHVLEAGDCDDGDQAVNPSAVETCNGVDDDCDDEVDEGAPSWTEDVDGDGHGDAYGAPVTACEAPTGYGPPDDCKDDDPDVYAGAVEVCDAKDNDCNSVTDDAAIDAPTWFQDCDGDGYGDPDATVTRCTPDALPGECTLVDFASDCDDQDCAVHPAAAELCNGIDDNCDLKIDDICDTGAVDTGCATGP